MTESTYAITLLERITNQLGQVVSELKKFNTMDPLHAENMQVQLDIAKMAKEKWQRDERMAKAHALSCAICAAALSNDMDPLPHQHISLPPTGEQSQ